jgi:hypothetical protein
MGSFIGTGTWIAQYSTHAQIRTNSWPINASSSADTREIRAFCSLVIMLQLATSSEINEMGMTSFYLWKIRLFRETYSCLNPSITRRRLCPPTVSVHVAYNKMGWVLGAFANWRKATLGFVMSVSPPVSLCARMLTPRLSADGFSWNLMLAYVSKICRESSISTKIYQE